MFERKIYVKQKAGISIIVFIIFRFVGWMYVWWRCCSSWFLSFQKIKLCISLRSTLLDTACRIMTFPTTKPQFPEVNWRRKVTLKFRHSADRQTFGIGISVSLSPCLSPYLSFSLICQLLIFLFPFSIFSLSVWNLSSLLSLSASVYLSYFLAINISIFFLFCCVSITSIFLF